MDSSTSTSWLTVIIPSYRGDAWLKYALQSIASQETDGVEVLVIDSSPTSCTRDIAAGFADQLQLRVFDRSDLTSWHTKTNFGVEAARSQHLCWLGVDDVWLPGRIAAVRNWIESAPHVAFHLAPSKIIGKAGQTLGVWRCPLREDGILESNFVVERLLVQNFIGAPAPVFRKDAWLACGGLDTNLWYTADWDMWLRLAGYGSVQYHDEVTIGFRIHGDSLTVTGSRDTTEFERQMNSVLERHLSKQNGRFASVERAARASIAVNTALASASAGNFSLLLAAFLGVLRLGPIGMRRYFRDSRVVERVVPRVRAKLTGAF
jgi:glycosyltransferase involved in cell wall biosynthesis